MAYGRFRGFVEESDDITRIIALIAFALLIIITLPAFVPQIPGLANGPSCSSMYSPRGNGSQQSLLARSIDPSALQLSVSLPQSPIIVGQPLVLNVRFSNQSAAPITLAIVADEAVFRFNNTENGILFFVESTSGTVLGEPLSVQPAVPVRQQFTTDQIHTLNPRQHCTQVITISPSRLAAAGMGAGQYQIIAVYRNNYHGVLAPVGPLTPTPVFPDQGVWVTSADGIRSKPVILTVSHAAQ